MSSIRSINFGGHTDLDFDVSVIYNQFGKVYSNRFGFVPLSESPYKAILEQAVKQDNASILSPNTYPGQNELLVIRPVPLMERSPEGYVLLHVPADRLSRLLETIDLGYNRKILILDHRDSIVASQDQEDIGLELSAIANVQKQAESAYEFAQMISWGDDNYYLSQMHSSLHDWSFVTLTPAKELTGKSGNIVALTWIFVAALAILWVYISIAASKRLYFPIQYLSSKFSSGGQSSSDGLKDLEISLLRLTRTNQELRQKLEEQLPYVEQNVLLQLLSGQIGDKEFKRQAARYGLTALDPRFVLLVIQADIREMLEKYSNSDSPLIMYAVRKMAEEICEQRGPCLSIVPKHGQVVLVINVNRKEAETAHYKALGDTIRENIKQFLRITVTVSVSDPYQGYKHMAEAYSQALALLDYRLFVGKDSTIIRSEVPSADKRPYAILQEMVRSVVFDVSQADFTSAESKIEDIFRELSVSFRHTNAVMGLVSYLIGELHRLILEMGYSIEEVFETDLYQELHQMTSLHNMKTWLTTSVIGAMKDKLAALNRDERQTTISQVVQYILENYQTDLSLQQVAEQFELSPSQLSKWFKEEKNVNFSTFLIEIRIEQAKEWLIHTDLPIKEIAERLRYTTVHNFTRIFKKMTGTPPGQFRNQYRGGDEPLADKI
ncbi:helix-turn-helix domain-containing protein [Paenibacillus residui]|uniref:Helix-turn-helix domain-containing protein n=1 Tax=Paenibacillus residui TaxID=629724 RepID=A0ABW3D4H5_9BACL